MTTAIGSSVSASERAYAYVNERLGWVYSPGDRLPLDEIARALRVSRQPVRDAVMRLAGEGLVAVVAQVGCIVVRPTVAAIDDLGQLLGIADRVFVPVAARRSTPELLRRLEAHVVEAERIAERDWRTDRDGYAIRAPFERFYDELYAVATSAALARTISAFRSRAIALTTILFLEHRRDRPTDVVLADSRAGAESGATALRSFLDVIADGDAHAAGELAWARATRHVERMHGDDADGRSRAS